jgi:hypothetical protein
VTRSKFHTENPQVLGITEQNLIAQVTWCPESVPPNLTLMLKPKKIKNNNKKKKKKKNMISDLLE